MSIKERLLSAHLSCDSLSAPHSLNLEFWLGGAGVLTEPGESITSLPPLPEWDGAAQASSPSKDRINYQGQHHKAGRENNKRRGVSSLPLPKPSHSLSDRGLD